MHTLDVNATSLPQHRSVGAAKVLGAVATQGANVPFLTSQLKELCQLNDRIRLIINVYNNVTQHPAEYCYTFSYVRGHKPLFWKTALPPSVVAPFDYIWLFDADIHAPNFPLQQMLIAMARTDSQISQPLIAPLKLGPKGRSSDWKEFRYKEPDLACMVRRHFRVEVMTPIFTRAAWELTHTHLATAPWSV